MDERRVSGRRRRRKKPEEHHVDERWMASYMDMVTVLMCLFIVLYAMSTVDANKFEKLRNSLATGFGAVASETVDTAEGTVVPPELVDENLEAFAAVKGAAEPASAPDDPRSGHQGSGPARALEEQDEGRPGGRRAERERRVPDRPARADGQTGRLAGVLRTGPARTHRHGPPRSCRIISPILGPAALEIMVEGHAANGITAYPSTWELSSARAVNVLRFMVDRGGIAPGTIGAVAFGSARQVNDDSTPELMERNRRVDIVVISDQPDVVRALIPEVLKLSEK